MTANENVQQQEITGQDTAAAALRRSEQLRVENERNIANNNAANGNNGNFTIRINVGGNSSGSGRTIVRRRRPSVPQQHNSNDVNGHHGITSTANQNAPQPQQQAPVHARTIDRFPGQQENQATNQQQQENPPRLVQMSMAEIQQELMQERQQQQQGNGQQRQRTGRERVYRIPVGGRGIRVTTSGGNPQVRILTNGQQQAANQMRPLQLQNVRVPPLVPQPLPFHGSHSSSPNELSEQPHGDGNEFKCLICFGMFRLS